MDILNTYLHNNGYKLVMDNEATNIYIENRDKFETICGEIIYNTLDDFMSLKDKDPDIIKLLIIKEGTEEPVSVFYGNIEDNQLSSDYTCSSQLVKGGALLRFYALLVANERSDGYVTQLTGGISGGIPPINDTDITIVANEKKERLRNYHEKLGATLSEDRTEFTYNLPDVMNKINEIFVERGGKKKRKTKKIVKLRKRKSKKRSKRIKHI